MFDIVKNCEVRVFVIILFVVVCVAGETPLSLAAIKGRSAALEYLLEIGASPEMVDDFNCSPLHHAAVKGRLSSN